MRYLSSILRIFVLVAVVLAIANFSDVQKVKAAATFTSDATSCTITTSYTPPAPYAFPAATCEGKNVTITGNGEGSLIIVMSGAHTFKNLTVTNGAQLTQEEIAVSDLLADGKTLDPAKAGINKKVDLNITEKLTLTNQGRIDVSGKGFPGGIAPEKNGPTGFGYGPGGGCTGDRRDDYSGGGHGGIATGGCSGGGTSYGLEDAPEENGSGGGNNPVNDNNGFFGGGRIKINTVNMNFDQNDQTFIAANGYGGTNAGGGAGGSIWLKVNGQLTSSVPSPGSPSTSGENSDSNYIGQNGTVIGGQATFGKFIMANGGAKGGAGGRIMIDLNSTKPIIVNNCNITSGDTIPAICEGTDVTVSSSLAQINMNKVQVEPNGSNWVDCSSDADKSINSACDSKRHFTNLTVENGAVITHEAVKVADMAQDTNGNDSLVDETTGTARWKKVDLDVTGSITLKGNSVINVDGKGYPGGQVENADGSGRGKGLAVSQDVVAQWSGGAGYQGVGGSSVSPYGQPYNTTSPQKFEFGSGSGSAKSRHENFSQGAAGGGRIRLSAGSINIDLHSRVSARGSVGNWKYDSWKVFLSTDTSRTATGGGSGGMVWINIATSNVHSTSARPSTTDGGLGYHEGLNGTDGTALLPTFSGFIADGGDGVEAVGGTGVPIGSAGGGGGWIVFGAGPTTGPSIQSKKVEVIVTWQEGSTLPKKTVKLYDVLRSVVTAP